ncbi:MAG: YihY/virulence factor BrkB family protein [Xanthobacteraceae bacterium]|nr:MAG: YihY/virulence factor BrkB family protein [Xanthobacteraceae bacterium]
MAWGAFEAFLADDGWAIASHIALSVLMALFPFLIVVTALAGFVGSKELADQAAQLLLETWPQQVAEPIAREIHNVLTTARGGVLTIGVVLALYFAANGVESLRIALNRAYNATENRSWWMLRLESVGYVLIAAVVALALALLIVLGPLLFATARHYLPWLEPVEPSFTVARYAIATVALVVTLVMVHKWLPAGRRRLPEIAPGIAVTILLSLVSGAAFSQYLARFAEAYVTTYAGLASPMIALVFLYFIAVIFIYGGELNAIIMKSRSRP